MGKYTSTAQQIIERKLARKVPRAQAFRQSRVAAHRAISDWEDQIEKILMRFDQNPPNEYREFLGTIEAAIGRENEFLHDLEALEASEWATGA